MSSSWQFWPPHPIYVQRGIGSKVWDIDENEYVDYHNGYGVMVMGHAHPKIVEAVRARAALGTHFAQPTEDALTVADISRSASGSRTGGSGTRAPKPRWTPCASCARATGRKLILKIEGSYHGHHDSLMVSVFPPADKAGPRDHPRPVPQTLGLPEGVRRAGGRGSVQRCSRGRARLRRSTGARSPA